MAELVRAGKVRHLGLSEVTAAEGDWRAGLSRFSGSAFDRNQAVVEGDPNWVSATRE